MMEIERPKIETAALSPDGRYGKFVVEPLERGFGTTLGNSLRRVLLSSLPGVAVTSVKIDGVVHEFTTIEGVREDVTEIVLNLKGIAAKIYGEAPKTVRVEAVGPCEVTAGTIKGGDDLEILNPEWHIATLGEGAKLVMELTFDKGRGYVPAEKNKQALIEKNDISTLPVDSIYTPVLKVNYTVENTRVGSMSDFDKLTLEVWTDSTITAHITVANGSNAPVTCNAVGNGRLDAVANAIEQTTGMHFTLVHYSEHALDNDTDSRACCYVGLKWASGKETWGCGTHTDIIVAGIKALVSAINNK